jgi:hypothetical protein
LRAHVARANPLWKEADPDAEVLVVIPGEPERSGGEGFAGIASFCVVADDELSGKAIRMTMGGLSLSLAIGARPTSLAMALLERVPIWGREARQALTRSIEARARSSSTRRPW